MAEATTKKAAAKKPAAAKKAGEKKPAAKKAAARKSTATTKAPAPKKAAASKKAAGSKAGGQLRVTQVRSLSGRPANHRATMEALGFRWHQQTLIKDDNPSIRGMLFQVRHLVKVEEVAGGKA